jgi:hypothetical protein
MSNVVAQSATNPSNSGSSRQSKHDGEFAPIALFVYNRTDHARQTVEALRANDFAEQSDLFVFSDGAKSQAGLAAVEAVRSYVRAISGFKSVTIVEREANFGLSRSVITGISQLCNEYGKAIAVEDDVITAPDFLRFMNRGLQRYVDEPKMLSVCAFNPPMPAPASYPYDTFCSYRFACWGWATWKNRWEKADWAVADYSEFAADREKQKRFDLGGDDLSWFLKLHMRGEIDSWDTIWAYTHFKHNALALLPIESKAYNIGLDGSGTHCKHVSMEQSMIADVNYSEYRFPDLVKVNPHFVAEIQRYYRPSVARKLVRFARRIAPRKRRFDSLAAGRSLQPRETTDR